MTGEFFPVFDQEKFGEDIQNILDKFQISSELRRQIFSHQDDDQPNRDRFWSYHLLFYVP